MGAINKKCQVPTPKKIAKQMLDWVGYKENLYGKRILENSCGTGTFLIEVVKRYIKDCLKHNISIQEIQYGIQRDIHGFEKDRKLHKICIANLEKVAGEFGLTDIHWNIKRRNALHGTKQGRYQFVIGNPPYVAYPELDLYTRGYLREKFQSCIKGKPDYYYAFIESSLNALSQNGKLAYLVPGNFMKNLYAEELRQLLLPSLYKIVDYSHHQLFDGYLTSSVILLCNQGRQTNTVRYKDQHYQRTVLMPKTAMQEKWIFKELEQYGQDQVCFGKYFHASAPIATQLNRAFVLKKWKTQHSGFVQCSEYMIEEAVVRDAAGPKAMQRGCEEKIIFPYTYDSQGALVRYQETEFAKLFPGAYAYLQQFRIALDARKKDEQAAWFEYGRSQLLAHLMQEKLILSTFVTERPRIYLLCQKAVPYAGICVTAKQEYHIRQARAILESDAFMNYVRTVGVCANGISYRIGPREINAFRFSREMLEG